MAIGVWQGLGVADGSMFRLSGGPDIIGRGCMVFADIEVLAVLEVLLERTPIDLCCWEREVYGSGGDCALVEHEQVLVG